MAITPAQFTQIKLSNPTVRMKLYPDLNGVANNRIIIYGLSSSVTTKDIATNGTSLAGVKMQKAIYTTNASMFFKDIVTPFKTSTRYIKAQGYGTATDTTARMIEIEAFVGATNVMAGKTTIVNDTASAGSSNMATLTDGIKTVDANTYPIWWSTVPNANVVFDLGSLMVIDKLGYFGYSINGDQRQNRFKILGSLDGVTWYTMWDMSANVIPQPVLPLGYSLTL